MRRLPMIHTHPFSINLVHFLCIRVRGNVRQGNSSRCGWCSQKGYYQICSSSVVRSSKNHSIPLSPLPPPKKKLPSQRIHIPSKPACLPARSLHVILSYPGHEGGTCIGSIAPAATPNFVSLFLYYAQFCLFPTFHGSLYSLFLSNIFMYILAFGHLILPVFPFGSFLPFFPPLFSVLSFFSLFFAHDHSKPSSLLT